MLRILPLGGGIDGTGFSGTDGKREADAAASPCRARREVDGRPLELSVHTINERLRDARRKLSASSSKEAARLLREAEGAEPNSIGDKQMGDAPNAPRHEQVGHLNRGSIAKRGGILAIGGLVMISLALAMLAFSPTVPPGPASESGLQTQQAAAAETAATAAAREWLSLSTRQNGRRAGPQRASHSGR